MLLLAFFVANPRVVLAVGLFTYALLSPHEILKTRVTDHSLGRSKQAGFFVSGEMHLVSSAYPHLYWRAIANCCCA